MKRTTWNRLLAAGAPVTICLLLCCACGSSSGPDDPEDPAYTGSCLSFDDPHMVLARDVGDHFDLGSAFTLELWYWVRGGNSSGARILSNGGGWALLHTDVSVGRWALQVQSGAESQEVYTRGEFLFTFNQWQHVAATYDGSTLTLYLNGELAASEPFDLPVDDTASRVTIGAAEERTAGRGLLDEIRIWNVARTQAEIQDAMNRRLAGDETGLVAYWACDEGSGQVLQDGTSHDLDAILGGSTAPLEPGDPTWVEPGAYTP